MGAWWSFITLTSKISYENAPWASDVVIYSYHSDHGRRSKLEVQQPGAANWAIDYVYDYDRRLDTLTSPAGQFDYDYIGAGRNIDTLTLPGGQYIEYGQDLVGWKTQQSLPDTSTVAYDYDNIGQLTGADASGGGVDFEYAYDTAWNLDWRMINTTTEDFSVNSRNEVTSSPLGNPTHDSNGNLTAMGTSGSWPTYIYDAENRLVSAEWYTTYPDWTRKVTYSYDGMSRLRKRLVQDYSNGYLYATISDTRYLYDGMLVIEERNASNTPVARYTRGLDLSGSLQGAGGIGGLLAREWGSNDAYYHADAQGNVTALINSSGTVMASYQYDSFGNLLSSSGTWADVNKYRFSSKEIDDTGLYYYGYRFYHPDLQRWMNRDPLGEAGGINLYAIVRNNPMLYVDKLGLDICELKRDAQLWFDLNLANHYYLFIDNTGETFANGIPKNYIINVNDDGMTVTPTPDDLKTHMKNGAKESPDLSLNKRIKTTKKEAAHVAQRFEEIKRDFDYSWPRNDCGETIDHAEKFLKEIQENKKE